METKESQVSQALLRDRHRLPHSQQLPPVFASHPIAQEPVEHPQTPPRAR